MTFAKQTLEKKIMDILISDGVSHEKYLKQGKAVSELIELIEKAKKEGDKSGVKPEILKLLICRTCGEPYINAIDPQTGKLSKHIWKGTCQHILKNIRVSVG